MKSTNIDSLAIRKKKQKFFLLINMILLFFILCGVIMAVVMTAMKQGEEKNGFRLVCETSSIAGNIPVYKYESLQTGLHVVIAKIEGPIVQGFFTIVTEAHDDDGLPHTLEHLIFLGSEEYPYRGVLDILANRCLAEGTNAWTDTDHTAYTVETAGSEGFLNLLPIYLDHLLYPTMTDAGFITEVYHITGGGEDAGVVYSEMQSRENTGPDLTYDAMVRALYPEPCGYHYQTGGMMANLRNSTTNEKVRQYHSEMYRPENLHIIITGQIEAADVFEALKPFEEKVIDQEPRKPFERPWESPIPPFDRSIDLKVVYPSDNEDTGLVRIGWRGPSVINNILEFHSLEVLLKYLTEHSVSPLPDAFVEIEDPLASFIEEYMIRNSVSSSTLSFYGVPKHKVDDVKPLLMDILQKIALDIIPFDLDVMRSTLNNLILEEESHIETSPHEVLSHCLIYDALYGHTCDDLEMELNKITWFEHLLTEPSSYWQNLIEKYLLSSPSVLIRGIPSLAEAERLQQEEYDRIERRKRQLGYEGLMEWEQRVATAKEINDIAPPDSMLESVPVPTTTSIPFHSLTPYTNILDHNSGTIEKTDPSLLDMSQVPVRMALDDVHSNFVKIYAILDTRSLSPRQKLYLPLLLDLLLESAIEKEGKVIPYGEVVKRLNADLLKATVMTGLSGRSSPFSFGDYFNNVGISFRADIGKYAEAVEWLSDVLFRVRFDPGRISVKATKLLNSIGDKKREGSVLITLLAAGVIFEEGTSINQANPLRQEIFLNEVLENLRNNSAEVVEELNHVYKNITRLDRITIHMAANLRKLSSRANTTRPWTKFSPNRAITKDFRLNVITDYENRIPSTKKYSNTGYIAGVGSLETGYLIQTAPSISNYSHPDLPTLMIAISYLTQLEGPMWKHIRGKGYAYHYVISLKPSEGDLTLKLGRAAQLVEAYREAMHIIKSFLSKSESFNRILFESARSSLAYEIIHREAEISDVIQQSIYTYHRKVPHDYNKNLLRLIEKVKLEDLYEVFFKYFSPMVDPEQSRTVVVCTSSKSKEIHEQLDKMGHHLEYIHSLENSTFSL